MSEAIFFYVGRYLSVIISYNTGLNGVIFFPKLVFNIIKNSNNMI